LKIKKDFYFGSYGWDDKTGKSLSTEEFEKLISKNDIVIRAPDESEEIDIKINLPNSIKASNHIPIIEDISHTIPINFTDSKVSPIDSKTYKLTLNIPPEISYQTLKLSKVKNGNLKISFKTGGSCDIKLPEDVGNITESKFVNHRLKIKLSRLQFDENSTIGW
jgi:hypothetical protein